MGVLRPQSSAVSPRRNSACSLTAVGSQKNPTLLPVHCSHTATWVTSGHLLRRKEKSNQVPAVQSSTINYLASFCYILSSLDASSLNLFTLLFFFPLSSCLWCIWLGCNVLIHQQARNHDVRTPHTSLCCSSTRQQQAETHP